MTQKPQGIAPTRAELSEDEASKLVQMLLRKEGTWVDWGRACQQLQKAGYGTQTIFEQTGFQGSQQNQTIVAAQVYESLLEAGVSEQVQGYFSGPRSDILYEFRILSQADRAAAAELAMEKRLDVDEAHQVVKAIKNFARLSQLPQGFSNHPGDAVAYECWQAARKKKDLQDRSRLIARGLKFASSQSAREQIELLLSDFSVVPSKTAPMLPVYRIELEEELPRIIPVVGRLPLTADDLQAVPILDETDPFRMVTLSGGGAMAPVPGWQVVLKAEDPVGILCQSDRLPKALSGKTEEVLVLIDRREREWDDSSYFLVARENNLEFQWSAEAPDTPILGKLLLVMRPKKIFDENAILQPWQMDD